MSGFFNNDFTTSCNTHHSKTYHNTARWINFVLSQFFKTKHVVINVVGFDLHFLNYLLTEWEVTSFLFTSVNSRKNWNIVTVELEETSVGNCTIYLTNSLNSLILAVASGRIKFISSIVLLQAHGTNPVDVWEYELFQDCIVGPSFWD